MTQHYCILLPWLPFTTVFYRSFWQKHTNLTWLTIQNDVHYTKMFKHVHTTI